MSGVPPTTPGTGTTRPIGSLLVANRGEIASRVLRTARRLGIATVAVYADNDRDLPFVGHADRAVRLAGDSAADTYLNIDRLVAAARASGAEAVHPGYGFLSESAPFARACRDAGLVFVGPSPEVIEAMGSKLAAKELVAAAGVPVLPGVEVATAEDVRAAGARIGWPLLVKAAFGGGGRGMRIVASADEAEAAVEGATREAGAAFGNATLFVERYVVDPRHIEVQIFGDHQGTVVHLFERECSIQRRYQKIIEESPSPAVGPELRGVLTEAAVAAGRALGYVGAGTVEFVVDHEGRPYFLEVNTRLQVEHPVTEAVTGLDLVELQLRVAAGEALPAAATGATSTGHAIEARLYAEDPGLDFLPQGGTLWAFSFGDDPPVRVDSGVAAGVEVSTHYDPMLAKVVTWARTREAAARQLARSLEGARIHGVPTNRDLLVRVLRHPAFVTGATDTGFLERHDLPRLAAPLADARARSLHAVAAALAARSARRAAAAVQTTVPAGWRNLGGAWTRTELEDRAEGTIGVAYRAGTDGLETSVDGEALAEVEIVDTRPDRVTLRVDGVDLAIEVTWHGAEVGADSPLGSSTFTIVDRFPAPRLETAAGSLLAPMPGSVVDVRAVVGQDVALGEILFVLEAMKMEHTIRAPHAGTLAAVHAAVGDQVAGGAVLAVLEEHSATAIDTAGDGDGFGR